MIYEFNAAEIFQMAIEIEGNGKTFYEKARDKVDNPEVKKVFESLMLEEIEHKKKFTSLKSELPSSASEGKIWDPENEVDKYLKMMADMHIFKSGKDVEELLSGVSDVAGALKLAIQFEKDSIIFFLTMKDATQEKHGRDLIGQLVKEEQGHLKRLSLQLKQVG